MTKQEVEKKTAQLLDGQEDIIKAAAAIHFDRVRQIKIETARVILRLKLSVCDSKEEENAIVAEYNCEKEKFDREYQDEILKLFGKI